MYSQDQSEKLIQKCSQKSFMYVWQYWSATLTSLFCKYLNSKDTYELSNCIILCEFCDFQLEQTDFHLRLTDFNSLAEAKNNVPGKHRKKYNTCLN